MDDISVNLTLTYFVYSENNIAYVFFFVCVCVYSE